MHEASRIQHWYCKHCKVPSEVKKKQSKFRHAQHKFDKLLKKRKRDYSKGLLLQIEECNTSDPTKFWNYVKKLGPNKKRDIPWEVEIDKVIVREKEAVLSAWRKTFENLYRSSLEKFDNSFKQERLLELNRLLQMDGPVDEELNKPITYLEVKTIVDASKRQKAVGVDGIPNELLKHTAVVELLFELFNTCLRNQMIPDTWQATIIKPIPKNNPFSIDPLQYRGLSLQCCIYKIFSAILNNRLVTHLDHEDLLSDTQNGFRKNRSCLHHIFVLTSIIRNKCNENKNGIIAAFVDFRKAFDITDRNLLYSSLYEKG